MTKIKQRAPRLQFTPSVQDVPHGHMCMNAQHIFVMLSLDKRDGQTSGDISRRIKSVINIQRVSATINVLLGDLVYTGWVDSEEGVCPGLKGRAQRVIRYTLTEEGRDVLYDYIEDVRSLLNVPIYQLEEVS